MSGEIDWSVGETGYDSGTQQELDDYLSGGGGYNYDLVSDANSGGTGADTTSVGGDIYGGDMGLSSSLNASDLFKLLEKSPLLKTLGTVGIGKLADKLFNVQGGPGGYKGGIPTLTASRQMLPIPTTMTNAAGQTVARRPGSGGISYFTPMQYNAPAAANTTAIPPANTTAIFPADTAAIPPELIAESTGMAMGGMTGYAKGGIANLGSYSDGGRLLRGPGDGVSDSIPATIGKGQPARLADGEFVIPARIVSELGNGSTEAGARKLYAMMARIKKARGKAKNIAADTKSDKHLPA
jgi:hypothetical protein